MTAPVPVPTITVREFVRQSYKLVSANSPTVPLHGSDEIDGITYLNQLLREYAGTGLLLTIANTYSVQISPGQFEVTCGDPAYLPAPNLPYGRLANLENAWLDLEGVTYPLIDQNRNVYLSAWKYNPLQGLPRFVILFAQTQVTSLRLYPAPSQAFYFNVRGKWEMPLLTANSNMDVLPTYMQDYLFLALAKKISRYKARNSAWTSDLEEDYKEAKNVIESISEVNTAITGDQDTLLNGYWRVKAGI